ncbi:MAG: lipid-binding SYLF domain-containing protein [Saprospiraceae bacterium]|jgi:lipid-binding SYLF domain-containing protein
MKYLILVLAFGLFSIGNLSAQEKEIDKLENTLEVLKDLQNLPLDGEQEIPSELLEMAEAVVIIPKLRKGGFVVGGKFGKGIAIIKNEDGTWSDPAFIKLTGGSLGFQIGYTSSDLFLIFKSRKTLKRLTTGKGKFTLGGDVAIAAGPKGRSASANTDLDFKAEIYSYSRSRGIFAGISLDGSELKIDDNANETYYGDEDNGRDIIKNGSSGLKSSDVIDKIKKVLNSF